MEQLARQLERGSRRGWRREWISGRGFGELWEVWKLGKLGRLLVGLSFPGRGSVQDSRLLADCPLGVLRGSEGARCRLLLLLAARRSERSLLVVAAPYCWQPMRTKKKGIGRIEMLQPLRAHW